MNTKRFEEVKYQANKLGKQLKRDCKIQIIISTIVGILALIICFKSLKISVNYETLKRENIELNKVIDMKNSIISDLQEDNMKLQEMIDNVKN